MPLKAVHLSCKVLWNIAPERVIKNTLGWPGNEITNYLGFVNTQPNYSHGYVFVVSPSQDSVSWMVWHLIISMLLQHHQNSPGNTCRFLWSLYKKMHKHVATFKHTSSHSGTSFIYKIRRRFSYHAKTETVSVFDINTEVLITMEQFIMVFLKTITTKDISLN